MDIHTAGLSYVFSPLAKVSYPHPDNEDAFYAAYEPWAPGWFRRLIAAAAAARHRRTTEAASISTTQLA